jgi:hypothetical protein
MTMLAAGTTTLWYSATGGLDQAERAALYEVLSDDERARTQRFHFAIDSRTYIVAHALLRNALSTVCDVNCDSLYSRKKSARSSEIAKTPLIRTAPSLAEVSRPHTEYGRLTSLGM